MFFYLKNVQCNRILLFYIYISFETSFIDIQLIDSTIILLGNEFWLGVHKKHERILYVWNTNDVLELFANYYYLPIDNLNYIFRTYFEVRGARTKSKNFLLTKAIDRLPTNRLVKKKIILNRRRPRNTRRLTMWSPRMIFVGFDGYTYVQHKRFCLSTFVHLKRRPNYCRIHVACNAVPTE